MSAIMLGMAFKAPMGTVNRKAVLLKLADHAHDDGTNIYPSVARIADETHLSTRTVQRVLAEFVDEQLLFLVENESGGRGKTRNYMLNVPMLQDLALGGKGDTLSPFKKGDSAASGVKRVTPETERVTDATLKGDTACHPNHQEPSEPSSDQTEDLFDEFWQAYPRRENRRQALVEFAHAASSAKDARIIIGGAKAYAVRVAKQGREAKYIKLPANWLADRLWEDESKSSDFAKAGKGLRTITSNDPEWNAFLAEYEQAKGGQSYARKCGSWSVPSEYKPGTGVWARNETGGLEWHGPAAQEDAA